MGLGTDQLIEAGIDTAQGVANAGMGLLFGGINDRRQLRQQSKLQDLQIKGNKEMIDYQKGKDLEMWKATGPVGMLEQIKAAELSPGLMYGGGGAGGATTGGSGSVSAATATQGGGGEMGLALQYGLMAAQKRLIDAQADKTKAEAKKTAGVDTEEALTRIKSLTEGIENTKAATALATTQERLTHIATQIQGDTIEDARDQVRYQSEKLKREVEQISRANEMNEATKANLIKTVEAQMIGAFLQNALTKAQTTKTATDTKLSETEIQAKVTQWVQNWWKLEIDQQNANTNSKNQTLNDWINDIQKSTGMGGEIIGQAVDGIMKGKR